MAGFLTRLLHGDREREYAELYERVVTLARAPDWYRAGGVPDTLDGRFDMVVLVLSLVLFRLEREGEQGKLAAARLTERFVEDMDGQVREIGFGDLVVGKQIGKLMGALGGRLGAYRGGLTADALVRNLWRGQAPGPDAVDWVLGEGERLRARINAAPLDAVLAGAIA